MTQVLMLSKSCPCQELTIRTVGNEDRDKDDDEACDNIKDTLDEDVPYSD